MEGQGADFFWGERGLAGTRLDCPGGGENSTKWRTMRWRSTQEGRERLVEQAPWPVLGPPRASLIKQTQIRIKPDLVRTVLTPCISVLSVVNAFL